MTHTHRDCLEVLQVRSHLGPPVTSTGSTRNASTLPLSWLPIWTKPELGRKQMWHSSWVTWRELNKVAIYKGVGRMWGKPQLLDHPWPCRGEGRCGHQNLRSVSCMSGATTQQLWPQATEAARGSDTSVLLLNVPLHPSSELGFPLNTPNLKPESLDSEASTGVEERERVDLEEKTEVANRLLALQLLLIYFIFSFLLFVARVSCSPCDGAGLRSAIQLKMILVPRPPPSKPWDYSCCGPPCLAT